MYGGVHFSLSGPDPDNITAMDHNALPMILDMHRYGIRIDLPYLRSLDAKFTARKLAIENETHTHIGSYQYRHKSGLIPFSIGSRDHLAQLLFEELRIQGDDFVPSTPKAKRFQVSEEVLKPFESRHPVVPLVNEWHSLDKLQDTYTSPLQFLVDSDSRIHTTFNTCVTATGRLSSSSPNLQQIPVRTKEGKEIRGAFIASPGMQLVSNDLSQIEMVWAAHRSQDPVMLDVFRAEQDIHTRTACVVFGLDYDTVIAIQKRVESKTATPDEYTFYADFKQFKRLPCKTTGFGVLYGQTAEGLQKALAAEGVFWTVEQCDQFIKQSFFGVYTQLFSMLERDYRFAERYALICDDFGRARLVPEAKSSLKRIRNEGIRKAGNHPEQSGAQGDVKLSMAELTPLYRRLNSQGIRIHPLLQIHDQLIHEVDADFTEEWGGIVSRIMGNAVPKSVPTRSSCDIADRWIDL